MPANLLLGKQAHQQQLLEELAHQNQVCAARAGVAWHLYGDQSTYYFYQTAKERHQATTLSCITPSTLSPTDGTLLHLSNWATSRQAESAFRLYLSAETPQGLFAAPITDSSAQQQLLAAFDVQLPDTDAKVCEGLIWHQQSRA